MAKVVIEFDTNEKSLAVSIDGAAVDNVVGAEVYRRGYYGYGPPEDSEESPEFCFSVMQAEKDKANDLTKMTRIIAAENPQAKLAGAQDVPGMSSMKRVQTAGRASDKAVADIIHFFDED
jgi:hypothetical protein